jgi:hypothetical protein
MATNSTAKRRQSAEKAPIRNTAAENDTDDTLRELKALADVGYLVTLGDEEPVKGTRATLGAMMFERVTTLEASINAERAGGIA